jgi:hypothetical protein
MKRHSLFIIALAVATLAASNAWAQRGGGRGFGRGGGGLGDAMLLQQTSVQEELKLSAEQIEQLSAALENQRESFGGLRDLSSEERRAKFTEVQQAQRQAMAKVLSEEQLSRLKQIALQQRGPRAFGDPEIAGALGLTDEQKQSVEAAQADVREQMRALFANGPDGDREAAREKFATLHKEATDKLNQLLTPDQQAKYKELLGPPFTGTIERPSFRGGRRRGPAPDRNTDASSPSRSFQLASMKKDDEPAKDKEGVDAKGKDERGKPRAKDRDKQSKGGKHARRHGQLGQQEGHARHRSGKSQHARHGHHGRMHDAHGRATMARHRGGPNARAWDHVAASLGEGPRWRGHGRGGSHHRGHGPSFAQRGERPYHHFAMSRRAGFGDHHGRGAALGHEHNQRGPSPWLHHFEHRGEQLAHHGLRSWSYERPHFADRDQRHFHHQRGRHHRAGGSALAQHGVGAGHGEWGATGHHGRGPHDVGHDERPRGHGPAHFAHHRRPHGHHHFTSWRHERHGERDMSHRGEHGPDGKHRPAHFEHARPVDPGDQPAPPRDRDGRRSQIGGPEQRLTGDGSAADRAAQEARLEQIERSLDQLAKQLRDLKIALRR